MSESRTGKSRWGIGLVVIYGGFVVFILSLVLVASCQDYGLVESNYYEKGLAYQGRLDDSRRASELSESVSATLGSTAGDLTLAFPPECARDTITSTVLLYRPSNEHWDRHFPPADVIGGQQRLALDGVTPGLWKLKISWVWRGESFFSEARIYLAE